MSFTTTQPEMLADAAGRLAGIGSTIASQNTAAMGPTTAVLPAAADQVSVLTAAQFSTYGQLYQSIGAQASAILGMFVNTLSGSAGSYAVTEAANTVLAG